MTQQNLITSVSSVFRSENYTDDLLRYFSAYPLPHPLALVTEILYSERTMTDGELLEQLRKIVREEVEAEAKHTHTDITLLKMEVKGGMSKLEDRVKNLEISNRRLEESQQRIEKMLDREVTDLAETQREILMKLDKLNDHEVRITQLEEDAKFLPH